MLEADTDLRTILVLLGLGDLETTSQYFHLLQRHMHEVVNPVKNLTLTGAQDSRLAFRRQHNA